MKFASSVKFEVQVQLKSLFATQVNGRYVEQIFMFHKNGRRLQDGGMEPFTAMEMASEWTMDEASPESMGPTTCEPGSELCSEDGFTFCSFPGWPCPAPMSRRAAGARPTGAAS